MKNLLVTLTIAMLLAAGCGSKNLGSQTQPSSVQPIQNQKRNSDPKNIQTTVPPSPAPEQAVVSNIFTYSAKPKDRVGSMVLEKINANSSTYPATEFNVDAYFSGTITVRGRLSAPTGNPEDGGMGPEYSLTDLTQDSLKKLPYLKSDTRSVWFGVRNPSVMKSFGVKNGEMVDMTINGYEYIFMEAGVWNQAEVATVTKVK